MAEENRRFCVDSWESIARSSCPHVEISVRHLMQYCMYFLTCTVIFCMSVICCIYFVCMVKDKGHAISNMLDLARAHNSHARYVHNVSD